MVLNVIQDKMIVDFISLLVHCLALTEEGQWLRSNAGIQDKQQG